MTDLLPSLPMTDYPRIYDGPIARFADSKLQQSITEAIAGIEPGKHVAVTAFVDQHETLRFAGLAKIGNDWSVIGVLEHTPGNGWAAEGAIRWSI